MLKYARRSRESHWGWLGGTNNNIYYEIIIFNNHSCSGDDPIYPVMGLHWTQDITPTSWGEFLLYCLLASQNMFNSKSKLAIICSRLAVRAAGWLAGRPAGWLAG